MPAFQPSSKGLSIWDDLDDLLLFFVAPLGVLLVVVSLLWLASTVLTAVGAALIVVGAAGWVVISGW